MQVVSYNTFFKKEKKKEATQGISVRYKVANPTAALKTKRKGLRPPILHRPPFRKEGK